MAKYPVENNYAVQFENFIINTLKALSFKVIQSTQVFCTNQEPDLTIVKGEITAICEVKFYRSRRINYQLLNAAAEILVQYDKESKRNKALIVSCLVPQIQKDEILSKYGVVIWDRSNIANFLLSVGKEDYLVDFGQFIMEAQQGLDTIDPYTDIDEETEQDPLKYFAAIHKPVTFTRVKKGEVLISELGKVKPGKKEWSEFEVKCTDILKYLFEFDLSLWNRQQRTDDELSRFDLICRINSQDDFWKTLVQSFYTRYILFEFKNYESPISQDQIYSTERYLYPKALRGTAIIIARNGGSKNAIAVAKGALRENGKLLLIINMDDLITMVKRKDDGNSPSDYLSNILDNHLISISR